MARSADPELRQWWRELIASFDSTRESVAEFCHRHEVSTTSFYGWRRKLASAVSAARPDGSPRIAAEAEARPTSHRQAAGAHAFLPVHVINAETSGSRSVHVHLPDGVSIELPVDQQELLFDLVAHVRGQSSDEVMEAAT